MATAQLKNSFTSVGEVDSSVHPSTLTLKLSVSDTALRYFVLANTHQQVLFFGQYALHHVADEKDLSQRIQKILSKDELLQLKFGEVIIGIDTPYMLLPPALAWLKNPTQHLQFCKAAGVNIAYDIPAAIAETLTGHFPKAKFSHLNSSFLEQLPAYLASNEDKLFVNVHPDSFDVVRFKHANSLLMMNRYRFKTETDFIYFLLICCEELNINRETTELVLIDEVKKPSKIYEICYRYFLNISFIEAPENIGFSREFKGHPQHLHFNLYTLTA
jgi:hypothetical protein